MNKKIMVLFIFVLLLGAAFLSGCKERVAGAEIESEVYWVPPNIEMCYIVVTGPGSCGENIAVMRGELRNSDSVLFTDDMNSPEVVAEVLKNY